MKLKVVLAALILATSGSAMAGEKASFPFSGYFSQQNLDGSSAFKQANCAFAFFKQDPDGHVIDYVLDLPLYEQTHKVSYLAVQSSQCDYDALHQSDVCTKITMPGHMKAGGQSFEVIDASDEAEPKLLVFPFKQVLDKYLAQKASVTTGSERRMGTPIYLHRCQGFGDAVLASHIGATNQADQGSLDLLYGVNGFDAKRIPAALRIMETIGTDAFSATLPGQ